MSKKSTDDLQTKLDEMLAQCIADLEALGYEHYDIIEHVRITNNSRTLGSAQDMNKAFTRTRGVRNSTRLIPGMSPLFRISITIKECKTDEDIKNVLYHEVIHTCPDCQNHGKKFKAIAAHINRVYGANVTVTKNVDPDSTDRSTKAKRKPSAKPTSGARAKAAKYIGREIKINGKEYVFTGMNDRPKNCCELKSKANGKLYICKPEVILDSI